MKERGITLIALVVSIIVLLILAGISISMLTGENGILNRAQEAKENTEKSQREELDKMTKMEAMVQTEGSKVSNPSSYGENSNAQATADGAGKYFALPAGANYVTGTVDIGVVVNIKGSEFVWVPVEDVVLDTKRADELPTSASNGTKSGKNYIPMAVKVGSNYKGILYDFFGDNSYLKYNNSSNNYLGNSTDYREPELISDLDGGNSDTVDGKITEIKLKKEYNEMIESVLKYKGFYIARYESGLDKTTKEIVFKNASVEKNNVITTNAGIDETNSWYGLYKKIKTFATTDDIVVSNMIWGSQYDAMMNWMAKTGKKVGSSDEFKTNKDSNNVTGINSNDVINNVYDLYGCHFEWTMESFRNTHRTCRGGTSAFNGFPAGRDYNKPDDTRSHNSARATIYIK